ncbi:MAG TPA: ATP-binding cassette domain-containing protein [Streptosporangiaceae bacterium]|nr:ATP-binding cassette domain-containing protein [Streptosporangiaceae bacterium]
MVAMIEAEGLEKRFGPTQALDGTGFSAEQGTVLALLGPNGAGKTTAVRVLSTLLKPDAGVGRICGYDVVKDAVQVRQLIALTGQYASVDDELTGSENLIMIGRLLGLGRPEAKAKARELLARFDLTDAGKRATKTYSGGMRRRLDLAASLVGDPRVIFLDEPTTGLDPRARNQVWDTIRGLTASGVTVLLTTQYLEEADELADHIAVIDRGRVVASGTASELKATTGKQTIEVRPVDRFQAPEVAELVTRLTGETPEVRTETGLVTATAVDPAVMSDLVLQLTQRGIVAAELALRLPSLDEVFLALTGHPADDQTDDENHDEPSGELADAGRTA